MQNTSSVLTVKELAKYLSIGMNVAYKLVRQPDFPAFRISERKIIIPVDALNSWLENNATKSID